MRDDLGKRIVTGVILAAAVIVAVVWLPPLPLAVALGVVVAIAAWEWSTLMGLGRSWARCLCPLMAVLGMVFLFEYCRLGGEPPLARVQPVLGLAGLWWAIALLWIKAYPASGRIWGNPALLALMGMLVLLPPWLAVVYLLSYENGRFLLLGMISTVAFADIGAYFAGKRFGRRRLAPNISPGKTWEGVWGGFIVCQLAAAAAGLSLDIPRLSLLALLAIVACTSLVSVLGDLLESMVKRHGGIKDSGNLLPGHGGLLDRIDGITAAAPVYALGLVLAGWHP